MIPSPSLNRRTFLQASTMALAAGPAMAKEFKEQSLFNGKDLTGWHTNRTKVGHGTGGRWRVEDGAIIGEQDPPGSGNGGLLLSDRKFGNFDLRLEMNPDWGPDSGVFFRCTEKCAGFQMYVDYHDRGNVGHLRGEMPGPFAAMPFNIYGNLKDNQLQSLRTEPDRRVKNWPAGVYQSTCTAADWLKAWKVGQWNTARIRCEGKYPVITTWINDLKVCHFDGARCTLPAYKKDHVLKTLGQRGSIGLQVHGGKSWPKGAVVRWRNIRIKELA